MARKKKEKVVLENIELKPQVIGYIYQKKNNVGRAIFILVAFALAIYYINDISVFINNLLGKQTAETIQGSTNKRPTSEEVNPNEESNTKEYYVFNNTLTITKNDLTLNNFNNINNVVSFDANNTSTISINLSNRKFFVETFTEQKKLLERHKIDFEPIIANGKMSFTIDVKEPFYYIAITEKTVDDYPVVTLEDNGTGIAKLTCTKGNETIDYSFTNLELSQINERIVNNNVTASDYTNDYAASQNKVTTYNNVEGITATFNSTANGYTAIINVDLSKANLENIKEKYYYSYKEMAKVVKFEMESYGFTCK